MVAQSSGTNGGALAAVLIIYLAFLVLGFVAGWKVLTKAGYSGWWVFITLVPLVGVIMFFVFAFSDWPILREVRRLRSSTTPPQQGQGWGVPPIPPPPFQG